LKAGEFANYYWQTKNLGRLDAKMAPSAKAKLKLPSGSSNILLMLIFNTEYE